MMNTLRFIRQTTSRRMVTSFAILCILGFPRCVTGQSTFEPAYIAGLNAEYQDCLEVADARANCNANDIRQIDLVLNRPGGPFSCAEGQDYIAVGLEMRIHVGPDMKNPGFFLNQAGGDALTDPNPNCFRTVMFSQDPVGTQEAFTPDATLVDYVGGNGPYFTASGQASNDVCADLESQSVVKGARDAMPPLIPPEFAPPNGEQGYVIAQTLPTMTISCTSLDGGQYATMSVCAAWTQAQNPPLCTGYADALPGAPSKCICDEAVSIINLIPDSAELSDSPSVAPSEHPTLSDQPSSMPSDKPTMSNLPSQVPTASPSVSNAPSEAPTSSPSISNAPSEAPTSSPTVSNAPSPGGDTTESPSSSPSISNAPSEVPTSSPSISNAPSEAPTFFPSVSNAPSPEGGTTESPSSSPSISNAPSEAPTFLPSVSNAPSEAPTLSPSVSNAPSPKGGTTESPSSLPSISNAPSEAPTFLPSVSNAPSPGGDTTESPSSSPSISNAPSEVPTSSPSISSAPSEAPTSSPSVSNAPTSSSESPSNPPSVSQNPSSNPKDSPSLSPTGNPTNFPSVSLSPTSPLDSQLTVSVPDKITYLESQTFPIIGSVVYEGPLQSDEEVFFEINLSTVPPGTKIFVNGVDVTLDDGNFDGEWLLIPANDVDSLTIENQQQFSGTFDLDVRATVRLIDGVTNPIQFQSDPSPLTVDVLPVAECPSVETVVVEEDQGTFNFGEELNENLRISDDGIAFGNNVDPESFIEFQVVVPPETPTFSLNVDDSIFGSLVDDGDSVVGIDNASVVSLEISGSGERIFTITSILLPNGRQSTAAQILSLESADLADIDSALRATLSLLQVSIGPEHTDEDGAILFRPTVADVNFDVNDGVGAVSILSCDESSVLKVLAVADTPTLNIDDPTPPPVLQRGENVPLNFQVAASGDRNDEDTSEKLSVEITIPLDPDTGTAIGDIVYSGGDLPPGVSITESDEGIWVIEADGANPTDREEILNMVLAGLEFDPVGRFTGTANLQVDLIATETADGDQVSVKTAVVSGTIEITVLESFCGEIQLTCPIRRSNLAKSGKSGKSAKKGKGKNDRTLRRHKGKNSLFKSSKGKSTNDEEDAQPGVPVCVYSLSGDTPRSGSGRAKGKGKGGNGNQNGITEPVYETRCVDRLDPEGSLDDGETIVSCGCCSVELEGIGFPSYCGPICGPEPVLCVGGVGKGSKGKRGFRGIDRHLSTPNLFESDIRSLRKKRSKGKGGSEGVAICAYSYGKSNNREMETRCIDPTDALGYDFVECGCCAGEEDKCMV